LLLVAAADAKKEAPAANQKKEAVTKTLTSKFYCGTEEGDLIVADWLSEKGNDEKCMRETRFHKCATM
jgi:hypothetical protein